MSHLEDSIEKYSGLCITAMKGFSDKCKKLATVKRNQKKAQTIGKPRRVAGLKKQGDILEYQTESDEVLLELIREMRADLKKIKAELAE